MGFVRAQLGRNALLFGWVRQAQSAFELAAALRDACEMGATRILAKKI
jgi:hypothetical protein